MYICHAVTPEHTNRISLKIPPSIDVENPYGAAYEADSSPMDMAPENGVLVTGDSSSSRKRRRQSGFFQARQRHDVGTPPLASPVDGDHGDVDSPTPDPTFDLDWSSSPPPPPADPSSPHEVSGSPEDTDGAMGHTLHDPDVELSSSPFLPRIYRGVSGELVIALSPLFEHESSTEGMDEQRLPRLPPSPVL